MSDFRRNWGKCRAALLRMIKRYGAEVITGLMILFFAYLLMRWEFYLWDEYIPAWWVASGPQPKGYGEDWYRWQDARDKWIVYKNDPTVLFAIMHGAALCVALIWYGAISACAAWKTWGKR